MALLLLYSQAYNIAHLINDSVKEELQTSAGLKSLRPGTRRKESKQEGHLGNESASSGNRLQKQSRPPLKTTDCQWWPAHKKEKVH
eukprot:1147683-Pelagomonas_calceolata.AAC.2